MVAEGFAGVDVRQVNFDERYLDTGQGIAQGDAGMGECSRIDDDQIGAVTETGVDAVDQ
ncbi:hypothetical protein D3C78_1991880 [compost metagenome]